MVHGQPICRSVLSEASGNGVGVIVKNDIGTIVKNDTTVTINRPPFATDEGEAVESCRLFEQRIADAIHYADAAVADVEG